MGDGLADPPLLLVFLELLEHADHLLAFLLAQHLHDVGHVLDDAQFHILT